jgi:hypothetical protein
MYYTILFRQHNFLGDSRYNVRGILLVVLMVNTLGIIACMPMFCARTHPTYPHVCQRLGFADDRFGALGMSAYMAVTPILCHMFVILNISHIQFFVATWYVDQIKKFKKSYCYICLGPLIWSCAYTYRRQAGGTAGNVAEIYADSYGFWKGSPHNGMYMLMVWCLSQKTWSAHHVGLYDECPYIVPTVSLLNIEWIFFYRLMLRPWISGCWLHQLTGNSFSRGISFVYSVTPHSD